jgi:hypothetical protein
VTATTASPVAIPAPAARIAARRGARLTTS